MLQRSFLSWYDRRLGSEGIASGDPEGARSRKEVHLDLVAPEKCNNFLPSVLLDGHLDCFVFCDRSLQRRHRFTTASVEQRSSVRETRSFS